MNFVCSYVTRWAGIAGLLSALLGPLPRPASAQLLEQRIFSMRVTSGPMKGAFASKVDANGHPALVVWYFSNVGLRPLVNKANGSIIREYLDAYLGQVNPETGTVRDYSILPPTGFQVSDSDDAYTATLLSLAVLYMQRTADKEWWEKHVSALKEIADKTLVSQQKENGLIRAREQGNSFGYLMDACENYGGLCDFVSELKVFSDSSAHKYEAVAERLASGISAMYDPVNKTFKWNDGTGADVKADSPLYPHLTAQVFPQLYKVPLSIHGSTPKAVFDHGWSLIDSQYYRWELATGEDASLGGFPWMVLSRAALIQQDDARAAEQLRNYLNALKQKPLNSPLNQIQELGSALETQQELMKK